MARKSIALRLSQTRELIESFEAAGLNSDRSYRFLSDMAYRLDRDKGLSKGQRSYLDNLIDQGIPKPKNEARVSQILSASEVDGMQPNSSTLKDFAYKIGKGWSLSEKQEKFLSSLIAKAEDLHTTGRFRPDPEMISDLEAAVAICKIKNGWYWQHRPGTAKAFEKIESWLNWSYSKEAKDELEALKPGYIVQIEQEPIIDEWACNKLLKAVKNQISELHIPRHNIGEMRWWKTPTGKKLALISDAPRVIKGEVRYDCLVDGSIVDVPSGNLLKRRGKCLS